MEDIGWIKLHRKINDSKIWLIKPFGKGQAWVDLVLNANHKDSIMEIRGNIIPIKRGQIGWSEITMSKRWGWSRNKVRLFLKWLKTEQQIEQQTIYKITSVTTIIKYDQYQKEQQKGQQKDNRRYTDKNDKNEKNSNCNFQTESTDWKNKEYQKTKDLLKKKE